VAELLPWSEPKKVRTKNGPRLVSNATPDQKFWAIYKTNKPALRAAGVSLSKKGSAWTANWWQLPSEEEQQAVIDKVERSLATDSDIEIPAPAGLEYLPFQRAGIAYAVQGQNTLIGDEMGLGKTIQAIGIINYTKAENVLIVCPAFLKINWRRELDKWLLPPRSVGIAEGKFLPDTQVVIINYDIVGKHLEALQSRHWDLRITDECHYYKNPKAKRTKAVKAIDADRKIAMSGTPISNRPIELHSILDDLTDEFTFWDYAKRYCNAHRNSFGWDMSGSSNLEELQTRLRSTVMVRRLKSEVLTELPSKVRQVVPLAGDEGKILRRFGIDPDATWAEIITELTSTTEGFEMLSKLRHEMALTKVPAAIEMVSAASEEGPVLVFCHHKDVVAGLAEGLENCVTATGDNSKEQRDRAVQKFQAGEANIFIGTMGACGVGLTLTRSAHIIFCELDWVPGNVTQAEDRAHRIGQTDTVLVQHLVLDGGLDAHIAQTIVAKQAVIDKALDRALDLEVVAPDSGEVEVDLEKALKELKEIPVLPAEQLEAIHMGIRILASYCDGARELDGMGFSKVDTFFGHSLAGATFLSPKQALGAMKLVNKYRRQLDPDLVATAKGE